MSTDTANYGFTKDNEDDFYNVNVVNANLDKIDTEMKRIEDAIQPISPTDSVKWLGTVAGTANALTVTHAAITSYSDGLGVSFAANANSTVATTLDINGLGAIPIKKANGTAVTNLKAGGVYTLRYRGSAFILQGEGGEYGNATEIDVAKGKTFGTDDGLKTGTATISKLPPFIPNMQKIYTSGELRSWNWLSTPVFARKGFFGIASTNSPDNVYGVKIFKLWYGSYLSLFDSATQPFLNATALREGWHYDDVTHYVYTGSSTWVSYYSLTQTAMTYITNYNMPKLCGPGLSGVMDNGYLYTIERASGVTYLHMMMSPTQGGGIIQTFSVALDAYNSSYNLPYVWRVQLIDGYVIFTRSDYKELRIYDLTLTLIKTITSDMGASQDALLIGANVYGLLSSTIVYDKTLNQLALKNTGLENYTANVHTYPYNWITSNN
ncbi:hypothetical protein MHI04_06390 [Lysinibacillus sp. FSL K6-1151]|uniref:hypothetical protein n=1 Tax=Lysinibacillus sp. FSL K6-1151 TaxID=2921465 RepID=UPI003159B298